MTMSNRKTPEVDGAAADAAEDVQPQTLVNEAKEIGGVILVALLLVALLRTFLFQPYTIPSASMEPNLYEGDYIVTTKWNYGYSKYSPPVTLPVPGGRLFNHVPKRGDIIVFRLPGDPHKDLIKRVIGLPGDRIQMKHDQLFINDQAVPVSNLGTIAAEDNAATGQALKQHEFLPGGREHDMQDFGPNGNVDDTDVYTVPEHEYFMMGDNRDNSEDSRFPVEVGGVGFVPEENLEGRAVLILLSWNKGASLWKPWTWLNLRWNRFFKPLH
jgi:signal peptidase I